MQHQKYRLIVKDSLITIQERTRKFSLRKLNFITVWIDVRTVSKQDAHGFDSDLECGQYIVWFLNGVHTKSFILSFLFENPPIEEAIVEGKNIEDMDCNLIRLLKAEFRRIVNEMGVDGRLYDYDVPNISKQMLYDYIGSNNFDQQFYIPELQAYFYRQYQEEGLKQLSKMAFNETQFWDDICKAAATHSEVPHVIANESLDAKNALMESTKTKYINKL